MNKNLVMPKDKIADFCRRHHIRWLGVFGSALREDFSPDSDADVLVEVQVDRESGFLALAGMERELAKIFGSDSSRRFVNGVLGTLLSKHGPPSRRKS